MEDPMGKHGLDILSDDLFELFDWLTRPLQDSFLWKPIGARGTKPARIPAPPPHQIEERLLIFAPFAGREISNSFQQIDFAQSLVLRNRCR
jgi:hypothetical protein